MVLNASGWFRWELLPLFHAERLQKNHRVNKAVMVGRAMKRFIA